MKLKEKENILMHKKTFDVFYLGNIEKIAMGNSQKRDTEAQLIDRIEEAQVWFQTDVHVLLLMLRNTKSLF